MKFERLLPVNKQKTSFIHLLISLVLLAVLLKISHVPVTTSTAISAVFVVLLRITKSITRMVFTVGLSVASFCLLTILLDILTFDVTRLYLPQIWGLPIFCIIFIAWTSRLHFDIPWGQDLVAALLAVVSAFWLIDERFFLRGGALGGVFDIEDNARWALLINEIEGFNHHGAGDFGPLVDILLSTAHSLTAQYPSLTFVDQISLAIICAQYLVLVSTPFLIAGVLNLSSPVRPSYFSLAGIGLGGNLMFAYFAKNGHLTTGISSVLVLLVLLHTTSLMFHQLPQSNRALISSQAVLVIATAAWFPIAPLAISQIAISSVIFWRESQRKTGVVITSTTIAVLLIVVFQLAPLGLFFQSDGIWVVGGLTNLLQMEGGSGELGPIGTTEALFLISFCLVLLGSGRLRVQILFPLAFMWLSLLAIRMLNLWITRGSINYGARKLETFMVLISIFIIFWILTAAIQKSFGETSGLLSLTILCWLLIQIPNISLFIAKSTPDSLTFPLRRSLMSTIATNVERGDSAVCLYDSYPPDNGSRYLAYLCSRWVAGFSGTDRSELNEWRKLVLGQIEPKNFDAVRSSLGSDILVIPVPPYWRDKSEHTEWNQLVTEPWRVARP